MSKSGLAPQAQLVLDALSNGSMSSIEAFEEFGITRLAARVKELRDAGYNVITEKIATTNRLGGSCVYARYHLGAAAT
jgi:hypothetical protein